MSEKKPSDQEIVAQFNSMKQELQAIAQKVGELEMESEEHKLVIDTISPLDAERKCYRLVGGVLVERTVKDVLPALQMNQDGIKKVIEQLLQSYKKKEEDFGDFQKKYNIKVK
ncbi:Cochaperone prefoldin complex subunit [Basidiobolus ranarum]|uniref:Cochaperone prefoldin complex subunit n=1 Tax=Basidiobolus ranarum TaxID=34480 RepID=A0ABR2W2J7_9FUNG